jgi:GH43 family beta-xylosidase
MKLRLLFIFSCTTLFFSCGKSGHSPAKGPASVDTATYNATQFKNPLLINGTEPYVLQLNGNYYFLDTKDTHISLYQATSMSYIVYAYGKTVYTPPINSANSNNVTSPKIYSIGGKWYIYYSADNGLDVNHRMFVLENDAANPLNGTWVSKPLAGVADIWAKDETVLNYNGAYYMIWSGWAAADSSNTGKQELYISKMTDPLTLDGTRVMISSPTNSWEQYSYQQVIGTDTTNVTDAIDESPSPIINPAGTVYLSFSANTCEIDNYSIGLLQLTNGSDPLTAANWQKYPNPVFTTSTANSVYGPGHSSFFKSIDGKQDWFIYDADNVPDGGCIGGRNPRMQMVTWNTDGSPNLGTPLPTGVLIPKPSGEVGE